MSNTIIIRKHRFAIQTASQEQALQLRRQMNDGWLNLYTHQLHKMLDRLHFPQPAMFIDKLSLHVDVSSMSHDPAGWAEAFSEALTKQLVQKTGAIASEKKAAEDLAELPPELYNGENETHRLRALLQYLQWGTLPAWCRHLAFEPGQWLNEQLELVGEATTPATADRLWQAIRVMAAQKQARAIQRLLTLLLLDKRVVFVIQVNIQPSLSKKEWTQLWDKIQSLTGLSLPTIQSWLLESMLQSPGDWIIVWLQKIEKAGPYQPVSQPSAGAVAAGAVWTAIAPVVESFDNPAFREKFQQASIAGTKADKNTTPVDQPTRPEEKEQVPEDAGYTGQAGLVILHPFLQSLFSEAGLLNEAGEFIDQEKQLYGVRLLRYLSGRPLREWELSFEKMLCGLEPDVFLEQVDQSIQEAHAKAADDLLKAVLEYWPPLRQSSIAALQETFICRFGKFKQDDSRWLLHIEKTGVDILLEQLPWSFSLIKLPWLEKLLEVVW